MKKIITFKVLLALILMSVGNVSWGTTVTWDPSTLTEKDVPLTGNYDTKDHIISLSFSKGNTSTGLAKYNSSQKYLQFYASNFITFSCANGYYISKIVFREEKNSKYSLHLRGYDTFINKTTKITSDKDNYTETWSAYPTNHIQFQTNDQIHLYLVEITYQQATNNNYEFSISNAGYATYYNEQPYFMPNGVDGYTISEAHHQGEITMNKTCPSGSYVPVHTPLLIKGEPGGYPLYSKTGATLTTIPSNNLLYGSLTDTKVDESGYYYYQLSDGADGLGFYWQEDTEHGITPGTSIYNHAGKCYLRIPSTSSVKSISLSELEDNYILGIDYVTVKPQRQAYNIFGMPVKDDVKGIVIKNGKKYFNR